MGDFLLGFGLLPYEVPLRRRVLPFLSRPPSSLSGPMPVQPNFRGQGLSCICGIASSSDGQMVSCHSFALLPPPPDARHASLAGKGTQACTPSRFIWSTPILCNTASTVASHGAKYQSRRVNLRGIMRILAHCIDK